MQNVLPFIHNLSLGNFVMIIDITPASISQSLGSISRSLEHCSKLPHIIHIVWQWQTEGDKMVRHRWVIAVMGLGSSHQLLVVTATCSSTLNWLTLCIKLQLAILMTLKVCGVKMHAIADFNSSDIKKTAACHVCISISPAMGEMLFSHKHSLT